MNMVMFTSPLTLWDAWFMVMAHGTISLCAGEALNHQPRVGNWVEKVMLYMIAFGAGGSAMGPFFAEGLFPNIWQMTQASGVAVFSLWLTLPYWRQDIRMLDRRKPRVPVVDPMADRRGTPGDQDDLPTLCSH